MKNIAIYSQETKDAKRIISFLKSIGVDTKHHKGQKEFKGYYYHVINGVFGTSKKLVDQTDVEIVNITELPDTFKPSDFTSEVTEESKYPCYMLVSDHHKQKKISALVHGEVINTLTGKTAYVATPRVCENNVILIYKYAVDPVVKVTKEQIAKMMNCSVSQLVIE